MKPGGCSACPPPGRRARSGSGRKLRSLGALYLQQSVCLLPEREETTRQVRRLLDRVRQHGGSAQPAGDLP